MESNAQVRHSLPETAGGGSHAERLGGAGPVLAVAESTGVHEKIAFTIQEPSDDSSPRCALAPEHNTPGKNYTVVQASELSLLSPKNRILLFLHGPTILFFLSFFYFIIFTFTYMCIHVLGRPSPPSPFQAGPVPPSCSLILLKRKHKR
jgi:hypothetical protein